MHGAKQKRGMSYFALMLLLGAFIGGNVARLDLERLKREFPAWRLIGERVELRKQGAEYTGLCPFHAERTGSFKVWQAKDGQWLWKCFGCAAAGNVFQFIERYDHIPFQEAVNKVAEAAGWAIAAPMVDSTFRQPLKSKARQHRTISLDRWSVRERALAENVEALGWLDQKRGITAETAAKFHLGHLPDVRAIDPSDEYADNPWLAFPCVREGQIVSVKLRPLADKRFLRYPDMETALFNEETIDPFDDVMLVEGEFDAMVLEQAGFRAVSVPSAGFTLTPRMRDALLGADTLYLAGDSDGAGRVYMDKLWAELRDRTYRLDWPEGMKDANQFFLERCERDQSRFRTAIEELKKEARSRPLPNFYSLADCLASGDLTNIAEHPLRMRFPWKAVDEMAVILPGDVVSSFATHTGTGKTTFWTDVEVEEAITGNQVVVWYSAELTPAEYAAMVASYLTNHDRRELGKEQYATAIERFGDARFYVGYSPELNRIGEVLDLLEWAIRRLGATRVVLDHLHFLCRNSSDQVREQENAMQRIKNLALKYRVIPVVIGQSRKSPLQGRGKATETSDAKGSESFMSDASTVFHLHREMKRNIDWDDPPEDLLDPVTQIRLYKARAKGRGKAASKLYLDGAKSRFAEIETRREAEPTDWKVEAQGEDG